jgi:hypothetical protein
VSDNLAAPAIRSLVAEIVSSYVKKNQIAPNDIPSSSTPSINPCSQPGKHRSLSSLELLLFRSGNLFVQTMSCAWSADGEPRCYVGIFRTPTVLAPSSIDPDGDCRRIIHSPRQRIRSSDPRWQRSSG